MKLMLALLLSLPLVAFAAEHGGAPAEDKAKDTTEQKDEAAAPAEQGGKPAEHGGAPAEKKP